MLLQDLGREQLVVDNKPEMIKLIVAQIGSVVKSKRLSTGLAGEIRGKCQFASNQMHGRIAIGPLHKLSAHQFKCRTGAVNEVLRLALLDLRLLLTSCIPRTLAFAGEHRPIAVCSDGACEGLERNDVTLGAVIFDSISSEAHMFGVVVPQDLVKD